MKYFPQRNITDCLLACVENLTQTPREQFPIDLIEWRSLFSENKENRYLTYSSVSNIMSCGGMIPFVKSAYNHNNLYLIDSPAILGTYFKGSNALHAVFFDGEKVYEPWTEEFYSVESLRVNYCIFDARQHRVNLDGFLAPFYFHRWDKGCAQSGTVQTEIDEKLIKYMNVFVLNGRIE